MAKTAVLSSLMVGLNLAHTQKYLSSKKQFSHSTKSYEQVRVEMKFKKQMHL